MSTESLESVVRSVVNGLARGEYAAVIQACVKSRLTADDLAEVIRDYGCTLIDPPQGAYSRLHVVEVGGTSRPTWLVRAPVWTREEGRSDLSVQLTISRVADRWDVELDDLLVF